MGDDACRDRAGRAWTVVDDNLLIPGIAQLRRDDARDYVSAAAGYKPLSSEEPRPTYWNLRFGTDTDDVVMVQVLSKDGQTTRISIYGVSAAVLAEMRKRDEQRSKSPAKTGPKSPPGK